jgi:hypothetical protein
MNAPPNPQLRASSDPKAKRVSVDHIKYLVEGAAGVSGALNERLRAVWQAIVVAGHPADRETISQQLIERTRRNGLDRLCQHRDGNDLEHVMSWGRRGWYPF